MRQAINSWAGKVSRTLCCILLDFAYDLLGCIEGEDNAIESNFHLLGSVATDFFCICLRIWRPHKIIVRRGVTDHYPL
jgi:hypothetical protein